MITPEFRTEFQNKPLHVENPRKSHISSAVSLALTESIRSGDYERLNKQLVPMMSLFIFKQLTDKVPSDQFKRVVKKASKKIYFGELKDKLEVLKQVSESFSAYFHRDQIVHTQMTYEIMQWIHGLKSIVCFLEVVLQIPNGSDAIQAVLIDKQFWNNTLVAYKGCHPALYSLIDNLKRLTADIYDAALAKDEKADDSLLNSLLQAKDHYTFKFSRFMGWNDPGDEMPLAKEFDEYIDPSKPVVVLPEAGDDTFDLGMELYRRGQVNVLIPTQINFGALTGMFTSADFYTFSGNGLVKIKNIYAKRIYFDYIFTDGFTNGVPAAGEYRYSKITQSKFKSYRFAQDAEVTQPESIFIYPNVGLDRIAGKITDWMAVKGVTEIVIKPDQGMCGYNVLITDDVKKAVRFMKPLLAEGVRFIIQERVNALPVQDQDGIDLDWNVRVFLTRSWQMGDYRIGGVAVRIDKKGGAVNLSQTASVASIEQLAERAGWDDETVRKIHEAIAKEVERFAVQVRLINTSGFVDFSGLDFIIRQRGDDIEAVMIEFNNHHSGGMRNLGQVISREEKDELYRPLTELIEKEAKSYSYVKKFRIMNHLGRFFPSIDDRVSDVVVAFANVVQGASEIFKRTHRELVRSMVSIAMQPRGTSGKDSQIDQDQIGVIASSLARSLNRDD